MFRKHFGLKHPPLGPAGTLWDNGQLKRFEEDFQSLLDIPGIGILTAETGLGKTAALRYVTKKLNPNIYQIIYTAPSHYPRRDFYQHLASLFEVPTISYRISELWKDMRAAIIKLVDSKIHPVLIIDEAQNIFADFFTDFPAFLNFGLDGKEYITVWLSGHPLLLNTLKLRLHAAFSSRIHTCCEFSPIFKREEFAKLIEHGLTDAGCTQERLFTESGIEIMRIASKGNLRSAHILLCRSLRMAAQKNLNHVPDDCVKEVIANLSCLFSKNNLPSATEND